MADTGVQTSRKIELDPAHKALKDIKKGRAELERQVKNDARAKELLAKLRGDQVKDAEVIDAEQSEYDSQLERVRNLASKRKLHLSRVTLHGGMPIGEGADALWQLEAKDTTRLSRGSATPRSYTVLSGTADELEAFLNETEPLTRHEKARIKEGLYSINWYPQD